MKFERIKYPDGQISAKCTKHTLVPDSLPFVPFQLPIVERINSYEDLMYVRSIADIHPGLSLFIPCLFGQRSDRRFSQDQSFDLKMIAEIINAGNFDTVEIFDPHSDVALALINNSKKRSSFDFVERVFKEESFKNIPQVIVSPDAGAYKKCFEYGQKLGCEVVAAVKHRDLDGKIDLKFTDEVMGKNCLIVDDLADGGYTFEVLSKILKLRGAKRVTLYVSHGYFNKGFDTLLTPETLDHIYCTNSVKEINQVGVTQMILV